MFNAKYVQAFTYVNSSDGEPIQEAVNLRFGTEGRERYKLPVHKGNVTHLRGPLKEMSVQLLLTALLLKCSNICRIQTVDASCQETEPPTRASLAYLREAFTVAAEHCHWQWKIIILYASRGNSMKSSSR